MSGEHALGLDFGTTNSVAAVSDGSGAAELVPFAGEHATGDVFRSALCYWEDEGVRGGVAHEAGPWAIAEYLEWPHDSRFIQSFKSVAASASFEHATIFGKRYRFEDLGGMFLARMRAHAERLDALPARIVIGRPVAWAGARPDEALARQRYDAMFAALGTQLHYVYEPLGAAFSYAARLSEPATILVADFGGGTSDFSVVRVAAPGSARRCEPLGSAGIGIAGDRFDHAIVDRLVLPLLGKGGGYRSFGKVLEIPRTWFQDFSDWSRLALMRNRKTMDELRRLQASALDPAAIGRMIALIDNELGFPLYDAVGWLKRALSSERFAEFAFSGAGVEIAAEVSRNEFEAWIAGDLAKIEATVDAALAKAGVTPDAIDRVFLTGGSSLIPAIRAIFDRRFGEDRIATGGSDPIAHGLALIGQEADVGAWAV